MENIASSSNTPQTGESDSNLLLHSNYPHPVSDQRLQQHVINQALHDREKGFSVNHLLELPGQQGHPMYHAALHHEGLDTLRHQQTLEHHQRAQKINEGKIIIYLL